MAKRTRWILGLSLGGLLLFGPGLYEWARICVTQYQMDRELERLLAEHERLAHERHRLESDPVYLEGLIRSTFKLAGPGELVVPLESPVPTPSAPTRTDRRSLAR